MGRRYLQIYSGPEGQWYLDTKTGTWYESRDEARFGWAAWLAVAAIVLAGAVFQTLLNEYVMPLGERGILVSLFLCCLLLGATLGLGLYGAILQRARRGWQAVDLEGDALAALVRRGDAACRAGAGRLVLVDALVLVLAGMCALAFFALSQAFALFLFLLLWALLVFQLAAGQLLARRRFFTTWRQTHPHDAKEDT